MHSYTEFPTPSHGQRETVTRYYLQIERQFMPDTFFYTSKTNVQYRARAVSTIAKLWKGEEVLDAYIPYLAMNYFDRFASKHLLSVDLQGDSMKRNVSLVAICCLTLAFKMRREEFSLHQFLTEKRVPFKPERITSMEKQILSGLNWRLRSITPFYFLDYYYPHFKIIGGFKRRCINEIIVQSQGDCYFTQFKPSEIARSAFLAAAYIAYPSQFNSIENSEELTSCWHELVHLCITRNMEICSELGTVFSTTTVPEPSTQYDVGDETHTTKYEEELTEVIVPKAQFRNTVLDKEEEEVIALTRQPRQDRGQEVVEAGEAVAGAETETKQQVKDKGKAVMVADTTEEENVAALTRQRRQNRGKEVAETSKEVVSAEAEAEQQVLDKGEIVAVADRSEDKDKEERGKGKAKFISEKIPVTEAASKKLMNFKLKWPITGNSGETLDCVNEDLEIDESRSVSIRCHETIPRTGNDLPLYNSCSYYYYYCIIL